MYFGGDEIPDSPFDMTSNPNMKDVVGELDEDDPAYLVEEPERNYAKNGAGMQRKASNKGDLIKKSAYNLVPLTKIYGQSCLEW